MGRLSGVVSLAYEVAEGAHSGGGRPAGGGGCAPA
jgi:hypothetical protein